MIEVKTNKQKRKKIYVYIFLCFVVLSFGTLAIAGPILLKKHFEVHHINQNDIEPIIFNE